MKPWTILLTGCGAPGTSGTVMALRQNPDNRPVWIVGVDVNADTSGQQLVDVFAPVFPPENIDYRTRLLDVCQRHGVDVVIPQTTREVGVLGDLVGWFAEQGIRIMASPAAARANDKWNVIMTAAGMIPTPPTRRVDGFIGVRDAAYSFGYPLLNDVVLRPVIGHGGAGCRVLSYDGGADHCSVECLGGAHADAAIPPMLISQYLPGPEYSVDCFRGEHVQIAIPRIRTAMRNGISTDTTIVDEPEMAYHALLIAERLELTGVYGVQFLANAEGVPCLLEVNPRVQGTMVASVLAGANVIWMGVREAMGEPVTEVPTVRIGTRCVRHWIVSEWHGANLGAMK